MKRATIGLLGLAVVAGAALVFWGGARAVVRIRAREAAPLKPARVGEAAGAQRDQFTIRAGAPEGAAPEKANLKAMPLSPGERASLRSLAGLFVLGDRGREGLNRFLKELESAGLGPVVARDENPFTGKMLTIRTKNALEGARYLHAQYFQDESSSGEPFRQHLSFEIRGSSDCLARGREALESVLGRKLGAPKSERKDEWIEWEVEGYSYWIKRLDKADIEGSPLNAYTIEDIGTCRIAKELIPEHAEPEGT